MERNSRNTEQAQRRKEEKQRRVQAAFLAMTDPERIALAETVKRRLGARVKALRGYTIRDFCLYGLEAVETYGTLTAI